jgi:bacillithiol synthase
MNRISIPRKFTGLFSDNALQLIQNQKALTDLINQPFSLDAFQSQITEKSQNFNKDQRLLLQKVLYSRYKNYQITPTDLIRDHLEKIADSQTFTITTGHQLNLFSGPIFFIYKILHVIKLCQELKARYPKHHFVPVYWMASEDHDFEEIKTVKIFNKSITWETGQQGAVGRFECANLEEVKKDFLLFFERFPESEIFNLFEQLKGKTYGEAFFKFIHKLFSEFGLIILDGDDKQLKTAFSQIMKRELLSPFAQKAVQETGLILVKKGFKEQVHPRPINLFFLNEKGRFRIETASNGFQINDTFFQNSQLLQLLEESPESFSPNVVLRPVYQEFTLPNLCYVGGVGELNYWLQLKSVFEKANVTYPLIQVRNSALWLDEVSKKKWKELDFNLEDIFKSEPALKKLFIEKNATEEADFTLIHFQMEQIKKELQHKTSLIDNGMQSWVGAETQRMEKLLEGIQQRLNKSLKIKFDNRLKNIEQVKERLFPEGELQERSLNFFQFCPDGNCSSKLQEIYDALAPMDNDFLIFNYD